MFFLAWGQCNQLKCSTQWPNYTETSLLWLIVAWFFHTHLVQHFSVFVVTDHGIDQAAESVHSTASVSVSGFFSVQAAGGPLLQPSTHDVCGTFQEQNYVGLPHLKHKQNIVSKKGNKHWEPANFFEIQAVTSIMSNVLCWCFEYI